MHRGIEVFLLNISELAVVVSMYILKELQATETSMSSQAFSCKSFMDILCLLVTSGYVRN
jgi:hypothetical protein